MGVTTNDHDAIVSDSHQAEGASPSACTRHSRYRSLKRIWKLPFHVFALGIPSFHKSLASKKSKLGLPGAIIVWKMIRNLASLLVGALIPTLFCPTIQSNVVLGYLVFSSLLQAALGLICSNILIIYFSNRKMRKRDPDELGFFLWSVWDLFSVPSAWTAWSTVMLAIALVIQLVHPDDGPGPPGSCGKGQSAHMITARIVLISLLFSFLVILFTFFLLHIRHLSRVLDQTTDVYTP
ncbi:hypothetical protein F5887DRAFT_144749 [Amanita rubescens]|nr:hypothetical protein F5887DRAFT_144749 [Amanita rubescens]